MNSKQQDLTDALDFLRADALTYTEWTAVGMGLKEAGMPCSAWEQWSARDPGRYHKGECARKWESFRGGSGAPLTENTIFKMAYSRGWQGAAWDSAMDWNDAVSPAGTPPDTALIDRRWIERQELTIPEDWQPEKQLIAYLETLFEPNENVGFVTKSRHRDGRYTPTEGFWDRTAGQLIESLSKCGGDIGAVIGDYDPEAGAWIRFNPLDGKGCTNKNVTEYRFALVESDDLDIPTQNAIIHQLELPCAALVYSGGKSLHAIVRVDAPDYPEYRRRVDYLYSVCQKNGLVLDQNCRNPSRLSRMPGVLRAGQKQALIETNIGKANWAEWKDWVEAADDDLPDTENMAAVWDNLPALSPPLIEGVLRQGHKMLLAGPSKAGKSFALIELCISIAEGIRWLGQFDCTRGRVLYINLELDRASCLHRFRDVYSALHQRPSQLQNIDIWNLRGASVPMDKLAPKLIRRAAKKGYIAIVLDPIYKVITGDENSADQMANFCNQFDLVFKEMGCAVIYSHNHSKGAQGGKRSMDRASGSGVFARDPDALLDMTELEPTEAIRAQLENRAACAACTALLDANGMQDAYGQDDALSRTQILAICREHFAGDILRELDADIGRAIERSRALTAWRIEGTLREFARFPPVNLWFDYPIHRTDTGLLEDLQPETDMQARGRAGAAKRWGSAKDSAAKKTARELSNAFDACMMDGRVTIYSMAEYLDLKPNTVKKKLRDTGGYWIDGEQVGRKEPGSSG